MLNLKINRTMVNLELLSELLDKALAKETEQSWNERYRRYMIERYGIYTFIYNVTSVCSSNVEFRAYANDDKSESKKSYTIAA